MITDDILLLYQLNDGLNAAERAAVESVLATDAVLRERLARIAADLGQVDALIATPVAVPDDTQRRWHAALERAAAVPKAAPAAQPASRRSWFKNWPAVGAIAVGSLAVLIGVRTLMPVSVTPVATETTTVAVSEDNLRFERGVRLYLTEARRQVEALPTLPPTEREEVLNLVLTHNRLYIAAAERASSSAVARSLRALNPVLETLEAEGTDRAALEGGIAQVGFEMKVIQARLAQRAPAHERAGTRVLAL